MIRILVVDDEEGYRVLLAELLTHQGYETRRAAAGADAIRIGAAFMPDLLVVDWILRNHVSGIEVHSALKAIRAGMRTILISGFASPDLEHLATAVGIDRYLRKPIEPDELLAVVREVAGS